MRILPALPTVALLVAVSLPSSALAWICSYTKAISGDTFIASCAGYDYVLRLYGIDAPDIGQLEHDRSTAYLDALLRDKDSALVGQSVVGGTPDRYGRYQAVVYKGGLCVNEEMVKAGMAFVLPEECRIPPCDRWRGLEAEAARQREGVWFAAGQDKPWLFRLSQFHLVLKNSGYYEDIAYVRHGRQAVAYEVSSVMPAPTDWPKEPGFSPVIYPCPDPSQPLPPKKHRHRVRQAAPKPAPSPCN